MELNETVRDLLAEELEKLNDQLPYVVKGLDEAADALDEAQAKVEAWSERLSNTTTRIEAIKEVLGQ
jgi:peptidoglycan hydrolase CwlO-like protein